MIVQVTLTKDECFLIKEMMPLWKKYADAFVFMVNDGTTDDTVAYLKSIKDQYNILEIIENEPPVTTVGLESTIRQKLFDAARKYSNKIICMDTDEYLDGAISKETLERFLDEHTNTTFYLQWIQYANKTQRRIDGPWYSVFHDRIGNYPVDAQYGKGFSHTAHLPYAPTQLKIDPNHLFVAHLQWLDKRWVAIKQYYWKVWDYVNHLTQGVDIIDCRAYDASVNGFNWDLETYKYPLQIREDIYAIQSIENNFKLKYIIENTKKYNIPNLGDWNVGLYEYICKQIS